MKLLKIQEKIINTKPKFNFVLKGKSGSGKTEALLYRILFLIKNYAYDENDNILYITKNNAKIKEIKNRYNKIEEENKYTYMSLLMSNKKPIIMGLKDLVVKLNEEKKVISLLEKQNIIKDILENNTFRYCKKLNKDNIFTIINEIKYMKNSQINSLDEYKILMKAPLKLRKNSKSREDMFNLFSIYNNKLQSLNYYDDEDIILNCIKNIDTINEDKFVHLIIDDAEELSNLELTMIMKLFKVTAYSTINISVNTDKAENLYSKLVRKGRVYSKNIFKENRKIFNFKESVEEANKIKANKKEELITLESFKFIDLKHKREYNFKKDLGDITKDIITEDNQIFKSDEVESVPVFNNIAAGEPILITPEQEDIFQLPKYWIKGASNKFILKVKGDSMIDANINNGDLVVIEQTQGPNNGDIVAVNLDGNATLKTLEMKEGLVKLNPANKKYQPIVVNKYDEFYILGKAIGVIKKS